MKEIRDRIANEGVRVKVFALFCVTVIAIIALIKLSDPKNIIINIIIAIGSFIGGGAEERRRIDGMASPGIHTLTETTTESKTEKQPPT